MEAERSRRSTRERPVAEVQISTTRQTQEPAAAGRARMGPWVVGARAGWWFLGVASAAGQERQAGTGSKAAQRGLEQAVAEAGGRRRTRRIWMRDEVVVVVGGGGGGCFAPSLLSSSKMRFRLSQAQAPLGCEPDRWEDWCCSRARLGRRWPGRASLTGDGC